MTNEQIAETLDEMIESMPITDRKNMGAVNWGDIGVRSISEVKEVWPIHEEPVLEVLVEEADPSCGLGNYLSERLFAEYGVMVFVRTEW